MICVILFCFITVYRTYCWMHDRLRTNKWMLLSLCTLQCNFHAVKSSVCYKLDLRLVLSTDMACERNLLMKEVYPALKDFCRERHGIEFQVRSSPSFRCNLFVMLVSIFPGHWHAVGCPWRESAWSSRSSSVLSGGQELPDHLDGSFIHRELCAVGLWNLNCLFCKLTTYVQPSK